MAHTDMGRQGKSWIGLTGAILLSAAIGWAQPQMPPLGKQLKAQFDKEDLAGGPGGSLCFDKAREKLVRCSKLWQTNGALIMVTASVGQSTVVSAAVCTGAGTPHSFCTGAGTGTLNVQGPPSASVIRCGCDFATEDIACATGGKWLVRVSVDEASIADGAFTMTHGYAVGGEVVPCLVQ